MTDILSGVLGDSAFGPFGPHFMIPEISPQPRFGKGLGHLFGAMQIEAFSDLDSYCKRITSWIETFKQAQPIDKDLPILVPGEPEEHAMKIRRQEGIPLNSQVAESLEQIAKELGLKI